MQELAILWKHVEALTRARKLECTADEAEVPCLKTEDRTQVVPGIADQSA